MKEIESIESYIYDEFQRHINYMIEKLGEYVSDLEISKSDKINLLDIVKKDIDSKFKEIKEK